MDRQTNIFIILRNQFLLIVVISLYSILILLGLLGNLLLLIMLLRKRLYRDPIQCCVLSVVTACIIQVERQLSTSGSHNLIQFSAAVVCASTLTFCLACSQLAPWKVLLLCPSHAPGSLQQNHSCLIQFLGPSQLRHHAQPPCSQH